MIASVPGAKEQGMAESRTEALTWGAWFASYIDGLRAQRSTSFDIPDHFENFLNSLEGELPELAERLRRRLRTALLRQRSCPDS